MIFMPLIKSICGRLADRVLSFGGKALNMYGSDPLRAQRFCKEYPERCNRPISYENALLSFGSSMNLTSREKVSVHWGN